MNIFALSDGEFGVWFCLAERDNEGCITNFGVEINEPNLRAKCSIYCPADMYTPDKLFAELAENWSGWIGERIWESLEGQLAIIATSDELGHITLRVRVTPHLSPDSWLVETRVHVEAGQLSALFARSRTFFAVEEVTRGGS